LFSLALSNSTLLVGGDFTSINNDSSYSRIASFSDPDQTPPSLTPLLLSQHDTIFSLSSQASDTLSDIYTVEYRLNPSSPWLPCTPDDDSFDSQEESFTCTLGELQEGDYTPEVRAKDNALLQNEIIDSLSFIVDFSSPILSDPSPSQNTILPYQIIDQTTNETVQNTQTTISLTTNENALCKYASTPNTPYDDMPNTFSLTGTTTHQTLTPIEKENSFFIRCKDEQGNTNQIDFLITFQRETPPQNEENQNESQTESQTPPLQKDTWTTDTKDSLSFSDTNYLNKKDPTLTGKNESSKKGTVTLYTKTKKGGTKKLSTHPIDEQGIWDIDIKQKNNKEQSYALSFTNEQGISSDISSFFSLSIDSDKPRFVEPLPPTTTRDPQESISFLASDETTEITHYQVQLYNQQGKVVRKWRKQNDPFYFLPDSLPLGIYTLHIRAYDKAGNKQESQVTIDFSKKEGEGGQENQEIQKAQEKKNKKHKKNHKQVKARMMKKKNKVEMMKM
jgi:hypothetical protein